jgi:hypothetical protein
MIPWLLLRGEGARARVRDRAAYFVLDTLGVRRTVATAAPGKTSETVGMLCFLGLVGCVLPASVIAQLVRRLGDLLEPGLRVLAAVSAGLGAPLLQFTTRFFAHVLWTALAFAAFAMLWLRRRRVLAGLAVTVDYLLGLAAAILGAYAR